MENTIYEQYIKEFGIRYIEFTVCREICNVLTGRIKEW